MKNVIGIDLGTTNCCVAIMENGRPKVIEDEKGYNILPSYIAVKGSNRFVVGHGAKAQAISNTPQTLRAVKRLIGRKFNTPEVEEARKRMGYEIIEGQNQDVLLRIGDVTLSPVDASSVLLKCIKGIAEKHLGREVSEAVITCPAYFTNAQRKATIDAGQKAGLKVLRLLNEPTAAALAYGYRKDINKRILIYDLGGGTFDVSILEVGNNVYEVLATNGDSYLGGEDFDNRLVDHLAANFKAQHKFDPRTDVTALQRVKDAAERAKCELSFVDKTQIMIPHIHGTSNLQAEVTRDTLERLTEDLVQQTFSIVAKTLEEANLQISDVEDVILVGGQIRMPRIQELCKSYFGKPPCKGVHPDEAVAIGAAVQADTLTEDKGDILLLDVTPFSLGIDSAGDVFTRIVAKNSTIPVSESRTFTTVVDNQEKVKIVVRQGENKRASDNPFLGEFILTGIRRAPKMEPKIDVVFRIDSNGILNVSAKDRFTGERQSILIKDYFERATHPDQQFQPVVLGEGESVTEAGVAPAEGAPAESVTVKARGLLRRLVGGLGRKKSPTGVPEQEAPDLGEHVEEPVLSGGNLGALGIDVDEVVPDPREKVIPPPPPRANRPIFDPYGVVPREDRASLEDQGDGLPVSRGSAPRGASADVEKSPNRTFGGQYTDPYAMLEKSGALTAGADPFSMATNMADPFALDGVDPFAVQEKRPLPPTRGEKRQVASRSEDLLGALDLDKLVDELSEGVPTMTGPETDLPVPVDRADASGRKGWTGWQTPGIGSHVDEAMALSEAGVDPFAVAEAGGRPGASFEDPTLPTEKAQKGGRPGAAGRDRQVPPVPKDQSNLPSDFLLDTSNSAASMAQEPTGAGFGTSAGSLPGAASRGGAPRKKPAKLKIAYKRADAFVAEYSENLSRGGTFIKTPSPLDLGRECLFELTVPNREVPIYLNGIVVWSSKGMARLEAGQEPGMGIKYLFEDPDSRNSVERILEELRAGPP